MHEDDALRAVRAAAEIRERLPAIADEVGVALRFRTGVNTGPVSRPRRDIAIGDAVNVAARLEQAAGPGEIVLGEQTLRLVRDAVEVEPLEPLELKGKPAPVPAFRLVARRPGCARASRGTWTRRWSGGSASCAMLREAWERAVARSGCHLFTLLGAAGVGKSRLVAELLAGVGDDALGAERALPALRRGDHVLAADRGAGAARSRAAAGDRAPDGGGAAAPQELFWEVRRLLESLAAERPVSC